MIFYFIFLFKYYVYMQILLLTNDVERSSKRAHRTHSSYLKRFSKVVACSALDANEMVFGAQNICGSFNQSIYTLLFIFIWIVFHFVQKLMTTTLSGGGHRGDSMPSCRVCSKSSQNWYTNIVDMAFQRRAHSLSAAVVWMTHVHLDHYSKLKQNI